MYLRDSRGKKSGTWTILVIGFMACVYKLLVADGFPGTEFGVALAALGALYQSTKVIGSKYPQDETVSGEEV